MLVVSSRRRQLHDDAIWFNYAAGNAFEVFGMAFRQTATDTQSQTGQADLIELARFSSRDHERRVLATTT